MGFEKRVLDVAKECGIEDAHFYEGTMFFGINDVTVGMVDDFVETVKKMFITKPLVSNVGNEIAVDFT
jgi:hypothetical protein